jgi:hypothetical protein
VHVHTSRENVRERKGDGDAVQKNMGFAGGTVRGLSNLRLIFLNRYAENL